jgi:hypothetical protein
MGSPEVNHYENVTQFLPHKLAALTAHESQTAHMEDLEGRIRHWMTATAADAGLPDGELAESFKVVNTA